LRSERIYSLAHQKEKQLHFMTSAKIYHAAYPHYQRKGQETTLLSAAQCSSLSGDAVLLRPLWCCRCTSLSGVQTLKSGVLEASLGNFALAERAAVPTVGSEHGDRLLLALTET
jgi:hypothetical protein